MSHPLAKANRKQREALLALYRRSADGAKSYREFRRRAQGNSLLDCVMIPWCGMWIGIELDGYAHS